MFNADIGSPNHQASLHSAKPNIASNVKKADWAAGKMIVVACFALPGFFKADSRTSNLIG